MELISREEVLNILNDICNHELKVYDKTYHLPIRTITISVTEQIGRLPTIESRPKGKWAGAECSVCGYMLHIDENGRYKLANYCSCCGADMRGEE